jgi:hypothetical protein
MPDDVGGPHVTDDLPRLLTSEATPDEVMSAARHLRLCFECRDDLISTAVAHGLLLSAQTVLREGTELDDDGPPRLRLLLSSD